MSGDERTNPVAPHGPQDVTTPASARDEALRARVREALAASEPSQVPSFDRLWSAAAAGPPTPRRPKALLPPRFAIVAAGVQFVVATYLAIDVRRDADRESSATVASSTPEGVRDEAAAAGDVPGVDVASDDFRLAARVAADFARPSPLDRLTASLPPTMSRGLPPISEYRYPLLPEEIPL